MPLSPQHQVFVDAFRANGGNGAKAARAAGYSGDLTACAKRGSKLLARKDIKEALAAAATTPAPSSAAAASTDARPKVAARDELLETWTQFTRAVDGAGTAIKIGIRDRLEASRLLARALGVFTALGDGNERPDEIDVPDWVPLIPDDIDMGAYEAFMEAYKAGKLPKAKPTVSVGADDAELNDGLAGDEHDDGG